MLIYCFEDDRVAKLAPIIHARPAYAITCAGYRLIDWLEELRSQCPDSMLVGEVRPHLQDIQKTDFALGEVPTTLLETRESASAEQRTDILLVNARLAPTLANFKRLQALVKQGRFSVVTAVGEDQDTEPDDDSISSSDSMSNGDSSVLAAWIPASEVATAIEKENRRPVESAKRSSKGDDRPSATHDYLCRHALSAERTSSSPWQVFGWPHDVVATHMASMNESMEHRIATGDYQQLQDGVFVGENVSIGQYASIHTSGGAIILEDNVKVGPFCFLEGPLYAGKNTRVIEHSAIKDGVSLGHTTKIGGEVEASIVEPYTNKQHHGFLGHSYLGSWINLGAGTCNSDLKNTYGKINIEYGDQKIATGMQFLGCIMGDYTKSAINTGIFTGKVIGVCSMMYGFVTGNVPSYVNYARLFGQTALLPPEVMVNTQARMFARRNVEQRQIDIDLIHAMYHLTEHERDESEQLSL